MTQYFSQISGVIIVGDLIIHHKRWLRFSREDSRIGSEMKMLCDFHGMSQLVREPTRGDYLLDLSISDVVGAKVEVLAYVADHKAILTKLPVPEIKEEFMERKIWCLKTADWRGLEEDFKNKLLAKFAEDELLEQFAKSVPGGGVF